MTELSPGLSQTVPETDHITVVSDPGIDDLVALALLDRIAPSSTHFTLVSTYGNALAEDTARNAQAFTDFMGERWQHRPGEMPNPEGPMTAEWSARINGPNGTWGVQPPSGLSQCRQIGRLGNTSTLISLAPCTETLRILREQKTRTVGTTAIEHIVMMGGAFAAPGNMKPDMVAECNVGADPEAARNLFEEYDGARLSVVPLDVTNKVYWPLGQITSIPETGPINQWLKQLLGAWATNYRSPAGKETVFKLHDPLAIYLTFHPHLAQWRQTGVEVITVGWQRGQTIYSDKKPFCNVAIDIPNPAMVAQTIYEEVFSLKEPEGA